jgi:histidinol-phosphate aminotransferase
MSILWSPIVETLVPYVPGEQPKLPYLTKLNTNENPYPPSTKVAAAITETMLYDASSLRLYPDPQSVTLRQTIADYHKFTIDHVFVGNGSDEVLAHAFHAFFQRTEPLLFADVTYSFYSVYCRLYGIIPKVLPLNFNWQVTAEDYTSVQSIAGIVIAHPNAPTGVAIPISSIEAMLQAHPNRVVLVDEAYVDFGAESTIRLITRYPNLLVVQTFSKSRSLAGLRVGFALGQPVLIEALTRIKDSFNSYPIDRIAEAAAVAAMLDTPYFEEHCAIIITTRTELTKNLAVMGFDVLPSSANFLFVTHPQHEALIILKHLRDRAILVRHFSGVRTNNYLRITIGTPEQCVLLVAALHDICKV